MIESWIAIPGAIAIGISLGLPGSGGSILAGWIPGVTQLALFACVMLVASWLMLRPPNRENPDKTRRANWKIAADGLAVGIVTGLVGVGGGFLIAMGIYILARSVPDTLDIIN